MQEKIMNILAQLVEGQNELMSQVTQLSEGQNKLNEGQNELRSQVAHLTEEQNKLTEGQKELREQVTQTRTILENETNVQIRFLYDARNVQNDVNERIFAALDRIEKKVDRLQLETAHVRIAK